VQEKNSAAEMNKQALVRVGKRQKVDSSAVQKPVGLNSGLEKKNYNRRGDSVKKQP